jgi:hypothetical protein
MEVPGSPLTGPQKAAFDAGDIDLPESRVAKATADLAELEVKDAAWRLRARHHYGWIILALLILQNIVVFGLTAAAGINGILPKIIPAVVAVTSATLLESAAIVQIIVKWLFKDITYPRRTTDPS